MAEAFVAGNDLDSDGVRLYGDGLAVGPKIGNETLTGPYSNSSSMAARRFSRTVLNMRRSAESRAPFSPCEERITGTSQTIDNTELR